MIYPAFSCAFFPTCGEFWSLQRAKLRTDNKNLMNLISLTTIEAITPPPRRSDGCNDVENAMNRYYTGV